MKPALSQEVWQAYIKIYPLAGFYEFPKVIILCYDNVYKTLNTKEAKRRYEDKRKLKAAET